MKRVLFSRDNNFGLKREAWDYELGMRLVLVESLLDLGVFVERYRMRLQGSLSKVGCHYLYIIL